MLFANCLQVKFTSVYSNLKGAITTHLGAHRDIKQSFGLKNSMEVALR